MLTQRAIDNLPKACLFIYKIRDWRASCYIRELFYKSVVLCACMKAMFYKLSDYLGS